MSLTTGTRLGPYEVIGAIGAGGMGEVYRARDTKLGRDVALKILSSEFLHDGERIARFRHEAQILASLNHPHIAAIYGLEESGSTQVLVLELVDGGTLVDRMKGEALPLKEALAIANQVAHALEAAHEKGIVHRDLKPANVALTANGQVKVLDFGLAKAVEASTSPNLSNSPTLAFQPTQAGVILGTAAYMAPEQARGKSVDKRVDLWALGCLLFEMLTGRHAFEGETLTDIVAAVMKNEPAWEALPPDTPPAIGSLLRRLLQKDPSQRLRDAGDAAIEIQEALAHPASAVHETPRERPQARWNTMLPWVATAMALVLAGAAFQWGWRRVAPTKRPVTRLELNLPAGVEINAGYSPTVAVSPDGSRVAFVGMVGGVRRLYVRRLDQFDSVVVRGTDTAQSCFFSPDGASLGFMIGDRTLKKISLADGLVVRLAGDVDQTGGATWGADDRITFVRGATLWQIPAAGGAPQQISKLNLEKHEISHGWPSSIAGGTAILFVSLTESRRNAARIEVLSPATGARRVIAEGTLPQYTPSGHLVFYRDGGLLAAPFDIDRLELKGSPVRVIDDLAVDFVGAPVAAISSSGALISLSTGAGASRLVWVSRLGVEQSIADSRWPFLIPRLAPDGRRIAVQITGDLWIEDSMRKTLTRLTSEETSGNSFPVWTRDGNRVVFRTTSGMRLIDTDGSGRTEAIPGSDSLGDIPTSISPDGTLAFVRQTTEGTSGDIYVLSLGGQAKPQPLVKTPAYDGGAQFSPDGRWMAYVSNESGPFEVYVRPFPGPDRRWLVSTQGGTHPHWNPSGKELFYRSANKMMVVEVSTGPDIMLSPPRPLFDQRYAFGSAQSIPNFDVSADGQRFLMVKDDAAGGRLNVVLNWFEELAERLPTK